jgi:hypothetical protein
MNRVTFPHMVLSWAGWALCAISVAACDGERKADTKRPADPASAPEEDVEAATVQKPRSAPSFSIDESGPQVGFSRSMLTGPTGAIHGPGLEQLKTDLAAEKEFIEGRDVELSVHRLAKPEWVSTYVEELGALNASSVVISTETRSEYPKSVPFAAASKLGKLDSCTVVGSVTADRGTAVWRVSGGTARKRTKGMSGPDFSITAETLASFFKGCGSDVFVVHAAEGVEWGLIYDFAASARALEASPIKRASVPNKRPVPGRAVMLDR